jgi:stage II sporulation protein D
VGHEWRPRASDPGTTGRGRKLVILILLLALWGPQACRSTRRAGAPDPGDGRAPILLPAEPRVRVLLLEGFQSVDVEGEERGSLRLETVGGEIRLSRRAGGSTGEVLGRGSGFRLTPAGKGLILSGRRYGGVIDAFVNPLGRPVVVNDISMEAYLKSVVPRELGPQRFPEVEALKAQAVAARTFAVSGLGMYADRGFDVFDDTRSQVYVGLDAEHPLSSRAVDDTRGVVATHRGRPIVSLYSSTCGGLTEAFHLIFKGEPIDYLRGGANCSDRSSPYYRWEEWIDLRRRHDQIVRYAALGRLTELKALDHGRSGRVVAMRFVGEGGDRVLRGNDIRFALGLRSNWIQDLTEVRDDEGYIERIRVRGKGWGHGVGMCQIGAVEMARGGRSHREILKHYYWGIELDRWY